MGWKGAVRTFAALAREAEKDRQRQEKLKQKQQAERRKLRELEAAAREVEDHLAYVTRLVSLHTAVSEKIDWRAIAQAKEPEPPVRSTQHEIAAKKELREYKPGFLERTFGDENRKRQDLESAIESAKARDEDEYKRSLEEHEEAKKEWVESVKLANRILKGDPQAFADAIKGINPFYGVREVGSRLKFQIRSDATIKVTVHVHGEEAVPKVSKSLLKSGKLSVKDMSKTKLNELYQDYVCSCILCIAGELFALLPAAADPDDEALQTWLSGGRDYADWLDRLTDSPPSVGESCFS